MNLIRVSEGKRVEQEPFKKNIKYPDEKVHAIANANAQIGTIFNEFWVRQVRNAFSHSKYKIESGFLLKLTRISKYLWRNFKPKLIYAILIGITCRRKSVRNKPLPSKRKFFI